MEDWYIDEVHVTPANVSECTQLKQVIEHCKPNQRVFTDKGYASKSNREMLKARGLKSGISYNASVGRPLSRAEKILNKLVSKVE